MKQYVIAYVYLDNGFWRDRYYLEPTMNTIADFIIQFAGSAVCITNRSDDFILSVDKHGVIDAEETLKTVLEIELYRRHHQLKASREIFFEEIDPCIFRQIK